MEEETPFLGNIYNSNTFVKGIPEAKPVFPPTLFLQEPPDTGREHSTLEPAVGEKSLSFNRRKANVALKRSPLLAAMELGNYLLYYQKSD